MSVKVGFQLLQTASALTRMAIQAKRAGEQHKRDEYKEKAERHLALVKWQPAPKLPDRVRQST